MRIVDIRERSLPISRYDDPLVPSGGLTTSAVALTTDVIHDGKPIVGYGFSSIGRFAQGGLIRERFAPRLLAAPEASLVNEAGTNIDPCRAWDVMMKGEKSGGHRERSVAVGTLDMALWDAAAKIAGTPLYRFLGERVAAPAASNEIRVYAGGGYPYPDNDIARLTDEVRQMLDLGHTHVKIKIGASPLAHDLKRIEAVLDVLPAPYHLAVDAMNAYDAQTSMAAAAALAPFGLWWFEDVCDPLDFDTQFAVAAAYPPPIAAGEALFSLAEAKLLRRHGGLRPERDILLFDPVHCYGLPEYIRIVQDFEEHGWNRSAFWPHGGHLFTAHVARAMGLGGAEVNPFSFAPFGGYPNGMNIANGHVTLPTTTGIGFEATPELAALFTAL